MVEQVCGTPKETFLKVAETLCRRLRARPDGGRSATPSAGPSTRPASRRSARRRSCSSCSATSAGPAAASWRCAGHATIQGSTDIPTLYNLLPGYLNTPSALKTHDTLADYIETEISPTSYWVHFPKFIVSLLKAWYGDAATKENDFGYDWLPKNVGDHSHMPMFVAMAEGKIKGFMAMGQNPAVGGQNAGYQRQGAGEARLDGRHATCTRPRPPPSGRTAPRSQSGELKPEEIATEVFLLPAAATAEMDGTYTNTQRLVQWHDRAADPPGDARSDLWFTVQLGLRLKELYADSTLDRDRPIQALTWDYIDPEENAGWRIKDEPSARAGPQGDQRLRRRRRASPVKGFGDLKADGSTACGAWIYSGVYAPTPERARRPQPRRQPQGRRLGRARLGLRLAGQPPDHVQPRLGRPRRATPGRRRPGSPGRTARAHTGLRLLGRRRRRAPTRPTRRRRSGAAGSASTSPTSPSPSRRPPRRSPTASASTSTTAPRRSS